MSAAKMQTEIVTDISLNAVLSEYNRELFKQYDLLFIDMSYGGTQANINNTAAHLRNYLQRNLEGTKGFLSGREFLGTSLSGIDIVEYSLATDSQGEVLKRQIVDYYEHSVAGVINDLLPAGNGLSADFWDQDVSSAREANQSKIDQTELPVQEVEPGKFEEVGLNNPADVANGTRGGGVLGLVLPNVGEISTRMVDPSKYASHRALSQGSGLSEEASATSGSCSDLLFQQYIFDKLGCYRNELEKGALLYQIEYLVGGKACDYDNLETVCKRILLGREAVNVAYIFTDSEKIAEAEAWAAALAAVILEPELLEPVKLSLLFAWAYVESLQDIRILLEGGRVPVQKTAATWHTRLEDILHIRSSLRSIDNPSGLTYKEYLSALLLTVGNHNKTYRTMDIIEMDIRKTDGNHFFRLDGCTDCLDAKICIGSSFGIETDIERRYGYYYAR